MVVKELSYSAAFNSVSEFAQNLYFFTTPHLDDFGKIEGNPVTLKARVIPLSSRSPEDVKSAIKELVKAGVIDWYEVTGKMIIKYLTFEEDQTGLNKRTDSKYPDNPNDSENISEVQRSSYLTEGNRKEVNKSESNRTERKYEGEPNYIADKDSHNAKREFAIIYPDKFDPSNSTEFAAKEVWRRLEPNKPQAFMPTYLSAVKKGLPEGLFYQFASEIEQDPNIDNPGKVFNSKVKTWIDAQKSRS